MLDLSQNSGNPDSLLVDSLSLSWGGISPNKQTNKTNICVHAHVRKEIDLSHFVEYTLEMNLY